jgi:hypothetical protein
MRRITSAGWSFSAGRYPAGTSGTLSYGRHDRFLGFARSKDLNQIGYQPIALAADLVTYAKIKLDERTFTAPYWFFLLAGAILPAKYVRRVWRTKIRVRNRQCISCGYDLRATPERCPECGAIPAK